MQAPIWRLILDPPSSGLTNMSVDRAIQLYHAAGKATPTLRLYGWSEPTLSLGRFQSIEEVDVAAAAASKVSIVRRPTGGRGVLHFDEVTYSVVAGVRDGIPRGVTASYAWILRGLVCTFRVLGIDASLSDRGEQRTQHRSAACYSSMTSADLTVGMKKLSGSAQVWLDDTVLQHGSLTISKDVLKEAELLRLDRSQTDTLGASITTISSISSPVPTRESIRLALIQGFTEALGLRFEESSLSQEELAIAADISGQFLATPQQKP